MSVVSYWVKTFRYFLISLGVWLMLDYGLVPKLSLEEISSFTQLLVPILVLVPIYGILTWLGYYYGASGMKDFTKRLYAFFIKR